MSALIEHESIAEVPAFHGHQTSTSALVLDDGSLDRMMRLAEIMASGKATIPQHLRGNSGDCLAVVMQAMQWRMNPFAVAQKTHLVNGVLGYEAQLVAAVVNTSGATKDRLNVEWFGNWEKVIGKFDIRKGEKGEYRVPGWKMADEEGLGVRISATIKGEAEPRVLELLLAQARTRNSTLWADDPKQQLAYLGEKRWARLHAPDVLLGVYTPDELEPSAPAERDITPRAEATKEAPRTRADQLKQRLASKPAPAALPAPSLDDVLLAISTAGGRAQMQAAKEMAGQLSEQDYAVAAQRYQQRVDELRAQAAPATSSASGFDLDGFKNKLASCNDLDTLDVMAADASSLADGVQLDEVSRLYAARRAELGA
ncbi:recombinase RecT [Chromobacterium haemolyticum]|uniref:Recombinase RecT n=1 Tax=Chromobacterium fluminis TaxID=3044269 RepID=A0ABX0LCL0_9NEIS|nr:RecT family recombinase [Chromobacterium haemolyticum]NHR06693.1 recombinase RecT [Chromobacterium haemolyticum]